MQLRELVHERLCEFRSQSNIRKPPHFCTCHTPTTNKSLANHHSTLLTPTTMQRQRIKCVNVHCECHSPTTHFRPCRATLAPIRGSPRRPPPPTSIISHSMRAVPAVRAGSMIRASARVGPCAPVRILLSIRHRETTTFLHSPHTHHPQITRKSPFHRSHSHPHTV